MNELTYPYPEHPTPGTTQELAPGVRWLTMPMPGSLSHINLYLLEDDDGWFVVDTGWANEETQQLWQQLFDGELGDKPVKGVICTHMHPDHVGQAQMITDYYQCPLYMTQAEYYHARSFTAPGVGPFASWQGEQFYTRAGMPAEDLKQLQKMWSGRSSGGFTDVTMPPGFSRLKDGDILTIGGNDWTVVVGSGHSPEHACLHCHHLGIMISGDQILPIITSNVSVHANEPEANPLKAWMDSLDNLLSTPENTLVLPAHNLPFYGVRLRLRELIDHHEDRMLAIEEHSLQPALARDFLPILFKRKLDPPQMMMALGEAIAHLHLLMHRNRIERTLHEDGQYRFVSVDSTLPRRLHQAAHEAPSDGPIMV
ncbi:MAG: MBL fold metallo-hydrolase [Gammaproteobacteria bacterium]|nr:MAG: MBL fold metallo-hydrolase [Gammaproteobacteria bacterium]